MRARAAKVLLIGLWAAISLAGADARAASIEQASCGKPGEAPCPLQKWMRANVAAKLADGDMAALAEGLEKAARLVPDPAWSSWVTLAMSGAAAAKKADVAGARASCKGCHDAWREAYRTKYRLRPIPR